MLVLHIGFSDMNEAYTYLCLFRNLTIYTFIDGSESLGCRC